MQGGRSEGVVTGPLLSGLYYINGDPTRTSIKLCKAHLEEQPHPLC